MSLVSNLFLLFVAVSVLVYYIVPHKFQWLVLLCFSYIYYLAGGVRYVGFILFSTLVTWGIALAVEKAEAGGSHKSARNFLVLGLILNFGMLGVIKYTNFMIENLNALFHMNLRGMEILLPLGISFYTFQSSGYLLDVYWKRCDAERNPVKYALFVSFFPQILQGPIGRYSRLAHQLYEPHKFEGKNITRGFERILWGFFKKMILADWAAVFVDAIFDNPDQYSGLAIFGVLFYTVQLYADFSGGMDVVIGIASMFGIELDENFKRPFFSISITDFWHRWHITLGTWMKDYVFYPVTLSKWMGKFGKWGKKVFGKKTGRTLPICLANLIVFFVVGVWHGAAWKYIVYGMYNGIIIAFSGLMAEHYRNWKKKFNITGKENWYHVFMIIRTFILVNISWFFDRADTVGQAFHMMKLSVTKFAPSQLLLIPAGKEASIAKKLGIPQLIIGLTIVAMGTSMPEAAVSITAAINKNAGITIGNVVGSNILNIFIILGITAVITNVAIQKSTLLYEIPFMTVITIILLIFGITGSEVTFIEGVIFWILFLIYLGYLFVMAKKGNDQEEAEAKDNPVWKCMLLMVIGGILVVKGSDFAVSGATEIARYFGMSERFIGLTIVALGTSLPELVTSVTAARRGNTGIAIGNIVGSNIFNILFVIGTTALICTVPFESKFIIDTVIAVLCGAILWIGTFRHKELRKPCGVVMLLCYVAYFMYLCLV